VLHLPGGLKRLLSRRSFQIAAAAVTAFLALSPVPTSAQTTLRVAAYNIKHGLGMDDRVDLPRIAQVLSALDADVITLQEVDKNTERTGVVDQVAVIARLMGYQGFHGAHRPYQGGEYGNAVLTRLPVGRVITHQIPEAAGSKLAVHEVQIMGGPRGTISVVSVHLAGAPEERFAQADSVTKLFAEVEHPVVLAGDFNSRRGDRVMGLLRDSWQIIDKSGDVNTFPSDAPDREIDFVLVRPAGTFELIEHMVIDEAVASDHRPILAVFRIW
jgi:endonuclease/exonuclease/phosphatase family metal-dependent hydrolase